jgi:D-3-phosphoglycerate dehydrogenase
MIKKKNSLLYYNILKYQPENLKILQTNFNVVFLENPNYDTSHILNAIDIVIAPLGYFWGEEKINLAPNLKIIASNTTGVPHIDVEYAKQKEIQVLSLKDESAFLSSITPTAELTWGLLIALVRKIAPSFEFVRKGNWDRRPFGGVSMLSKMSLGVAGLGRLGSRVASYGICFGMKVRYFDPNVAGTDIENVERVNTLEELVKQSDVVTIHIPHEAETENLFNEDVLSRFKQGSYLINTSRGELVDHKALLKYLENGTLGGVAMDVFEGEFEKEFTHNFKNHPLLIYAKENDNLLITPHIGGSTIDAWRLTEEFTIKMILKQLS